MKKWIALITLAVRVVTYAYVFAIALPAGDYYVRTRQEWILMPNLVVAVFLTIANIVTLLLYSGMVDERIDPAEWLVEHYKEEFSHSSESEG